MSGDHHLTGTVVNNLSLQFEASSSYSLSVIDCALQVLLMDHVKDDHELVHLAGKAISTLSIHLSSKTLSEAVRVLMMRKLMNDVLDVRRRVGSDLFDEIVNSSREVGMENHKLLQTWIDQQNKKVS